MIATLVVGTACTSQAQDDKDKKITIQITKEVDGETKTFKGEYRNEEEMRSDPAFQEFAGDDTNVFFFNGEGDEDRFIELRSGQGARAFSFNFDDDDFPHRMLRNFHHGQGGPRAFFFGDEDSVIDLRGWNSEEFEAELEEKMKELEEKLQDLDKDLQEDIMDALKEIESIHSEKGFPKRIHRGGISIGEVDDEFGKRGKVDSKNKLELDDNYMIMGKRLTLRFRTPEEGELSVTVSNENGKDIYNRYFESFGGTFSDQIDFSSYSDGKYLLEIDLDGKRLTKKIVIE